MASYIHINRENFTKITTEYLNRVGRSYDEINKIINDCLKYQTLFREEIKPTSLDPTKKPKALFLLGPAGSGKSFVFKKLSFPPNVYLYNPDQYVEAVLDLFQFTDENERILKDIIKDVIPESNEHENTLSDYFYKWKSGLTIWLLGRAKECSFKDFNHIVENRASLIIDRPGDSLFAKTRAYGSNKGFTKDASVNDQMKYLKKKGYDIFILIVYTDLETCLKRNRGRKRSLPPHTVKNIWKGVIDLIPAYQAKANAYNSNQILIYDNRPESAIAKDTNAPPGMVRDDTALTTIQNWFST